MFSGYSKLKRYKFMNMKEEETKAQVQIPEAEERDFDEDFEEELDEDDEENFD